MLDCIFCKIVKKEINAYIVAENDNAIAFLDVQPVSNGHTLVIPKNHHQDLSTTPLTILNSVIQLTQFVSKIIEKNKKLDCWGINYLSNQGKIAGQEINHFHIHIIPKYAVNEGFESSIKNRFVDKELPWLQKQFLATGKKLLKSKYER